MADANANDGHRQRLSTDASTSDGHQLRVGARAIDPLALAALSRYSGQSAELTLPPAWPSHLPPPPPPTGDPPWKHSRAPSSVLADAKACREGVKACLAPTPARLGPIWMHSTAPSFEAMLAAMREELRAQLRAELSATIREELRAELRATVQAELSGAPSRQPGCTVREQKHERPSSSRSPAKARAIKAQLHPGTVLQLAANQCSLEQLPPRGADNRLRKGRPGTRV